MGYVVADETNTGGGASIGRDVETEGGKFVGRDETINVSYENNNILLGIQEKLNRLSDSTTFEFRMQERDTQVLRREVDKLLSDVAAIRRDVDGVILVKLAPTATNAPPIAPIWLIILLIGIFIFSFIIVFILLWLVRKSF